MPLCRLLGDDQRQKDRHGLAIRRVERHGRFGSYEYPRRLVALYIARAE